MDDSLEWSMITDGYWHRFIVVAPEPVNYSAREIRLCAEPTVSIQNLLVIYKKLFKTPRKFSIVEEEIPTIKEIFDHYNQLGRDLGPYEFFLGLSRQN